MSWLSRCFFIAGPTASGKSDAAVAVAEACGGEIVNADAAQVYRGLDILTAKPSAELLARAPHHLVGTVELVESFHVARYRESATLAIDGILGRNRLPVVVGGSGMYLRALTRGLSDAPPSEPELRAELNAAPLAELLARLEKLDPAAAAAVDRKNPRRVVRALEVAMLSGKPFSSFRQEWRESPAFHGVLLERPREELYERIDRRTDAMFEQGVVEEVRAAVAGGIGPTAGQILGLRPIQALLRGELTKGECIAAIRQSTRHYAKRQMTWFRREPMAARVLVRAGAEMQAIREMVERAGAVARGGRGK